LTLKGKSQLVPAHRLLSVQGSTIANAVPTTSMVGRESEMRLLTDSFEAAVGERSCRMVSLVGDAGVGKTRLTKEFLDAARTRATVVGGRCLPYGDGITFWPVLELVQSAAGLLESDTPRQGIRKLRRMLGDREVVDRVAAAIGLREAPFQISELFWGIRRFLEILAATRPLVVVFDDIHWAEPTLLDLLGHLTANVHDESIFILCTARSQLLEDHPTWGQGDDEALIVLSPLSDADAERVVDNLLGEVRLADAVRGRVVAAAEGNPLFVEQLVSMLKETGKLQLVDDRWEPAGDLSTLEIPPTIHALLAARLDQLPDGERATIDPASVIGQFFATGALGAIVDEPIRDEVPERLNALAIRQLVRPTDPAAGTDTDYRFSHLMVRDAAYAGMLKRTRARLHERFVGWADEANRANDRATEFEEILGYHLEQAHRYLVELGAIDDHAQALGIDASGRLGSAGLRAFTRGDMPATANLLGRAVALLPDGHPARPNFLFQLALALTEIGEAHTAESTLSSSAEAAAALGNVGLAETAKMERLMVQYISDPSKVEGDIETRIRESIAVLEGAGDEAGLARAWLSIGQVRIVGARWGDAAEAMGQVILHAQRAGDRVLEIRVGPNLALCARFGPMPVPEAIALCEDIIARSTGDQKAEAVTLRSLAHLHAKRGEFELAREEYRRARKSLEGLGWTFHAAITSIDSGPIEMLAGDPVAAEAELRRDYATLDRLGERNFISTVAAYLAEALWRQGRIDDASAMATFSADVAAPDDVLTQVALRRVRGKILAGQGLMAESVAACREAVDLSRTEDDPTDQAEALADLAFVLRRADDEAAAIEAAVEALQLHEQKGNTVAAAGVQRFLAASPSAASVTAEGR
jgi:tetratricopeptide (TPR) repeat protein